MTNALSPLVAYYRVSTERQGQSGLGLDAQRAAVSPYAAGKNLLGEFVEIESGKKNNHPQFVAVDMPHANRLTLHILAAVAEHEREMISQRTIAALAVAKARCIKLGNPRPDIINMRIAASAAAAKFRAGTLPTVRQLRADGRSLRNIAQELNSQGVTSARGRHWHAASVRALLCQKTLIH